RLFGPHGAIPGEAAGRPLAARGERRGHDGRSALGSGPPRGRSPMRIASVLLVLCLAPGVGTAHAQGGIRLSWDDCGASGVDNKSFACNTNADSSMLVASFTVVDGGPCFVGTNCVIDIQVADTSLPAWWQLKNPGSCRPQSLRGYSPYLSPVSCYDPAEGCGVGGVASYTPGEGGPNRARIITSYSVPCAACFETLANIENYATQVVLRSDRTVGAGSCDGCTVPACIVLNTVQVYASNPTPWDHLELTAPIGRNDVTWQGGAGDCPGSTPAINRTWGSLKSAYR